MVADLDLRPIVTILVIFLSLYFPTGQLLSPRWRPVVWSGIGFLVLAVVGNAHAASLEEAQRYDPGLREARQEAIALMHEALRNSVS